MFNLYPNLIDKGIAKAHGSVTPLLWLHMECLLCTGHTGLQCTLYLNVLMHCNSPLLPFQL